ncbi:MAG: hypothetical protein GXN93_03480 [Candidatus Diapherotrites archaeon]|nr:hypothetical protein [Candidatus Diapherotrites archaeon]
MGILPEVGRIGYGKIIQHIVQGFAVLVIASAIIFVAEGTAPRNLLLTGLAVLLFMYVDVLGLDGGAVYGLARLLGSQADYDDHVSYIARWKPYVFAVQALGIVMFAYSISAGIYLYYAFIGVELCYFWVTLRRVHRLDTAKTLLIIGAIIAVMAPAFLSSQSLTTMSEVARGNLNALMK